MKKSDQYMKLVYWSDEDQAYIGRSPGLFFGGVHGEDEKKVYAELVDCIEGWIDIAEENNDPLPPPTAGKSYSGKFNLRVGEELHEILVMQSIKNSLSLNSYCKKVLEESTRP